MKRYMILAATVVMTACGVYKPYERPEVVTDGLYGKAYATTEASVADMSWEEYFADAKLQSLIAQGLEHNSDLRAAEWRIKEAEEALKSARLAYLPSFNLAPEVGISNFAGNNLGWTYGVPLAASWQVDIFGGITNAKRRAKAVYAESQEYKQAVRVQLIATIATYYYKLVMLDEQLEATRLVAESLEASTVTMRAMMEAGMGNITGVAQLEAAAYDARATMADIEHGIRTVESSLCALLGDVPHAIERGEFAFEECESLSAGVPVSLLANRPDVRMAEYRLMQSHYNAAAARSQLYPSLTLSGVLGWTNNVGSVVVNPGAVILSAAASLTAPIFNAGKLRAQVRIAEAQYEEALIAFQQSLLDAGNEVNAALSQIESARSKCQLRTQQVEALRTAADATQQLMTYGSTTYLEVLTAQQNLLAGMISAIADLNDMAESRIALYSALGGGRDSEVGTIYDDEAKRKASKERRAAKK